MRKKIRFSVILAIATGLIACSDHKNEQSQVTGNAAIIPDSTLERRVEIQSRGWKLIGDLRIPVSEKPLPVVLMLNKAAGDRTVYKTLATALADRGIASLRLDLPGHGESTNLGKFVPGSGLDSSMIWVAEKDVIAALDFLKSNTSLDSNKVCMVGGSYSGEEIAEAGRLRKFERAYVMLSPGSFSEESIRGIDQSAVPWLFIVSNNERFLKEITASVQATSKTVELLIVPGTAHASNILIAHPGLAERIAIWISHVFKK